MQKGASVGAAATLRPSSLSIPQIEAPTFQAPARHPRTQQELETEVDDLQSSLLQQQTLYTRLVANERSIAAVEKERDAARLERSKMQRERDAARLERDNLQRERDAARSERDKLQRNVTILEEQKKLLQSYQTAMARKNMQRSREEAAAQQRDLTTAQNAAAAQARRRAQADLTAMTEKRDIAVSEVAASKQQNNRAQSEVVRIAAQIEQAQAEVAAAKAETEQVQAEAAAAKAETEQALAENATLTENLKLARKGLQVAAWEERIESAETRCKDAEESEEQVIAENETLKMRCAAAEANATYASRLEGLATYRQKRGKVSLRLQAAEKALEAEEKEGRACSRALDIACAQVTTLKTQLDTIANTNTKREFKRVIVAKDNEIEDLKRWIKSHNAVSTLTRKNGEVAKLEARIERLQQELEELYGHAQRK